MPLTETAPRSWRTDTRVATIENMIREAILLHRRTASLADRVMLPLRAVQSHLGAWTSDKIRMRWLSSAGPQETTACADTQPVMKPRQLRPIVVPLSLDELHGPSSGLVVPPRRLWWSGEEDAVFDLDNRARAAELYEAIFDAARTYRDIADYLDAGLLIELWSDLGLRRATRQAWEAAHPVLAASTASGNAA
jgi:hypothetical protein